MALPFLARIASTSCATAMPTVLSSPYSSLARSSAFLRILKMSAGNSEATALYSSRGSIRHEAEEEGERAQGRARVAVHARHRLRRELALADLDLPLLHVLRVVVLLGRLHSSLHSTVVDEVELARHVALDGDLLGGDEPEEDGDFTQHPHVDLLEHLAAQRVGHLGEKVLLALARGGVGFVKVVVHQLAQPPLDAVLLQVAADGANAGAVALDVGIEAKHHRRQEDGRDELPLPRALGRPVAIGHVDVPYGRHRDQGPVECPKVVKGAVGFPCVGGVPRRTVVVLGILLAGDEDERARDQVDGERQHEDKAQRPSQHEGDRLRSLGHTQHLEHLPRCHEQARQADVRHVRTDVRVVRVPQRPVHRQVAQQANGRGGAHAHRRPVACLRLLVVEGLRLFLALPSLLGCLVHRPWLHEAGAAGAQHTVEVLAHEVDAVVEAPEGSGVQHVGSMPRELEGHHEDDVDRRHALEGEDSILAVRLEQQLEAPDHALAPGLSVECLRVEEPHAYHPRALALQGACAARAARAGASAPSVATGARAAVGATSSILLGVRLQAIPSAALAALLWTGALGSACLRCFLQVRQLQASAGLRGDRGVARAAHSEESGRVGERLTASKLCVTVNDNFPITTVRTSVTTSQ
eukprot:scaffold72009_cov60-Phaeocystis_antarctica.AAC.2